MRQRRLQTASIAILAALVLGTGVASTDLTASANSRSQANPPWMSTQLQPGWNMVGWVGPETASRRLFAELPALQRISAWDAEQRRYRRAWRDQDEELPALTPGMGLWLLIGGDAPVQWRRPIALEGAKLRLRPGLNLVGWTGDDGTPVGEALDRLGNSVSVAWVWDAGSGQYTSYTLSAAGAARTQLALSRGDALWIHVSEPAEWRQPGSADPPVVFLGEIPAYIKMSIVAEYENVQTFFAERFGVEPKAPPVYVGADEDSIRLTYIALFRLEPPEGLCGVESIDQVSLIALRCAHPRHVLELAPQQMRALLDLRGPESYPGGPEWITRGAQLYGVSLYRAETGRRGYEAARGDMINSARRAAMPLRDGEANGGVAFLAVEWLAARAGDPSIFEYYRLLPSSETWKEAFATAFGITIEEFFAAFEEYRAELVLPVAHLADDRTGPVLVFLGDVPEDREAAIRADFERVGAFVSERFEAEPREFTLYVGPDKESLRDVVPSWPIYASTICSGFVKLDVAIISLTHPCSTSTRQDVYYIQAFLPGYGSTPEWMHVGAEGYVTAAYHAVAKGLDIAEHRASLIEWARRIPTPLQSLETSRGVAGISLALGYFAVEWLAERAGEPALFDFYEQLSPRDDWKQVFEATFGISLEDFYEEFEAHIAEITQQ